MIKYFQQCQTNRKNFEVVTDSEKATHFQENGGEMKSISELTLNSDNEEPLLAPVLNFDEDEENQNDKQKNSDEDTEGLPLPVLNFDKNKK